MGLSLTSSVQIELVHILKVCLSKRLLGGTLTITLCYVIDGIDVSQYTHFQL